MSQSGVHFRIKSPGGAGGGEVSPGENSTGFSSRSVIVANSSGQLVDAGSGMQWDSTKFALGINTSNPLAQLDVISGTSAGIRSQVNASSGGTTNFLAANGTTAADAKFGIAFESVDVAGTTQALGNIWMRHTSNAVGSGQSEMQFFTRNQAAPVQRMVLNSSGHVAIGSTIANVPFDVHTAAQNIARFQTASTVQGIVGFHTSMGASLLQSVELSWRSTSTASAHVELRTLTTAGGAPTNALAIDSKQHVGIGTTAPAGPLQVNSGTTAVLTVTTANRVGIGTTAPADALHVTGSVRFSSAANSTVSFFGVAGSTQASSYTTGSASTGRTLPSTISTVAGLMTAGERDNFNRMAQVLETLIKNDFAGYGLLR